MAHLSDNYLCDVAEDDCDIPLIRRPDFQSYFSWETDSLTFIIVKFLGSTLLATTALCSGF